MTMLQKTAPLMASLVATLIVALPATTAQAVTLPAIKASSKNTVPACVTPGRLMSYLKNNNPKLRSKFSGIATEYMRHGEALGLRWDYAFFQMLVETGFLRFKGDVKWTQNNFAGLGATGGGVRGEAFSSISKGVKAHMEHLSMYSGAHVENPTAERTRKIQEWKVLTKWQRQFKKRPMTFKDMARKWAPGSRGYPRDIEFVGNRFYGSSCKQRDPQPELVLAARGGKTKQKKSLAPAKMKVAATKKAKTKKRYNLGASKRSASSVKVLNGKPKSGAVAPKGSTSKSAARANGDKTIKTASIAGAANQSAKSAASGPRKSASKANCRVWSASYGGTKAVIIKAVNKDIVNYTVLKVNDGRVQPEAKAYIHAYAKGGSLLDKFSNPDQALEKAFQLCPEG